MPPTWEQHDHHTRTHCKREHDKGNTDSHTHTERLLGTAQMCQHPSRNTHIHATKTDTRQASRVRTDTRTHTIVPRRAHRRRVSCAAQSRTRMRKRTPQPAPGGLLRWAADTAAAPDAAAGSDAKGPLQQARGKRLWANLMHARGNHLGGGGRRHATA